MGIVDLVVTGGIDVCGVLRGVDGDGSVVDDDDDDWDGVVNIMIVGRECRW